MPAAKKVAIVGGETHIGEVTKLAGSRLEIVGAAVREEQMDAASKQFGGFVTTDFRLLLDRTRPEIVAVANENDRKAEVCLEALRRGMHVIADKPIAITLEDTRALRDAAAKANRRVLLLLTLRGHPEYRKAREIVLSGEVGEPLQIYGKMSVELKWGQRPLWFFDRRRSGGPILDLAIHMVDQFEWVTGRRLVEVFALERDSGRCDAPHLVDCGAALFRLDNGGTALLEFNRLMPGGTGSDYRLCVVGTRGQIDLRMGAWLRVLTAGGWRSFDAALLGPPESVVENWLDALENRVAALVPENASFRANEICCLAALSAAERARVPIET